MGMTHLVISLPIATAESGRRVHFGTLAGLSESLEQAKVAGHPAHPLKIPTHPALLVIDETGCCSTATSSTSAATATG